MHFLKSQLIQVFLVFQSKEESLYIITLALRLYIDCPFKKHVISSTICFSLFYATTLNKLAEINILCWCLNKIACEQVVCDCLIKMFGLSLLGFHGLCQALMDCWHSRDGTES